MKKILLILSQGRNSSDVVTQALRLASEPHSMLHVVYVVDQDMAKQVERDLAETGFIGDKPGEGVTSALQAEYVQRGLKILEDIRKKAANANVAIEAETRHGIFLDVCEEMGNAPEVEVLVFSPRKEGFFKKMFEGSEISKLKGRVRAAIKTYS